MPRCTICESQHDSEAGVVQHIFMSGGDHDEWNDKGVIWRDSDELITRDVNDGDVNGSEGSETVEFPEAEDGGGSDDELPCGHESIDPAEAPDPPFTVTCDTCGESWTVTEL